MSVPVKHTILFSNIFTTLCGNCKKLSMYKDYKYVGAYSKNIKLSNNSV